MLHEKGLQRVVLWERLMLQFILKEAVSQAFVGPNGVDTKYQGWDRLCRRGTRHYRTLGAVRSPLVVSFGNDSAFLVSLLAMILSSPEGSMQSKH